MFGDHVCCIIYQNFANKIGWLGQFKPLVHALPEPHHTSWQFITWNKMLWPWPIHINWSMAILWSLLWKHTLDSPRISPMPPYYPSMHCKFFFLHTWYKLPLMVLCCYDPSCLLMPDVSNTCWYVVTLNNFLNWNPPFEFTVIVIEMAAHLKNYHSGILFQWWYIPLWWYTKIEAPTPLPQLQTNLK